MYTSEARSRNHSCPAKAISITCSECVSVALGIQYAIRMRRIILSPVAGRIPQHFSAFSDKQHDLQGGRGGEQ